MKLILQFTRAPGDVLMLTGLVRDLKLTYGDDVQVDVRTKFPGLWRHNPYLTSLSEHDRGVKVLRLDSGGHKSADSQGIGWSRSGQKIHYAAVFHRVFSQRTGMKVEPLFPHGDLHLSAEERAKPLLSGRYWIVVPGGKTDMTNKWWSDARWQEVVDRLRGQGVACVQEGATKPMHVHNPLRNVLNLVGQTSIRDMIVNIHHAEGVICGCTLQMHIAGALQKPCVVILGGREEPWFEAYVDDYRAFGPRAAPTRTPHKVLHTLGLLDCCRQRGCWLRRVEKLNDGRPKYDRSLCLKPIVRAGRQPLPACMDLITTDHVVEAAMSYYEEGYLDPIGQPSGKYREPAAAEPAAAPAPPPAMPPLPVFLRPSELQQASPPAAVSTPPATAQPTPRQPTAAPALSHTLLGGRVTLVALLFGDDVNLHRRCLNGLTATVPAHSRSLRIIANQVGVATRQLLSAVDAEKIYWNDAPLRKFQAMRQVFHDPELPLAAPWLVWFDDVAYPKRPDWLNLLAETIALQSPEQRVGLLGQKLCHILSSSGGKDPREWFRRGAWFKGRNFRTRQGAEAPNGDCIHYAAANFFAVSRQAIEACQLPDARLRQSGGGIVIGEQLHQNGFQIKAFNGNGAYVHADQPTRKRGYREPYPWQ